MYGGNHVVVSTHHRSWLGGAPGYRRVWQLSPLLSEPHHWPCCQLLTLNIRHCWKLPHCEACKNTPCKTNSY